jgi:hypothetical protein
MKSKSSIQIATIAMIFLSAMVTGQIPQAFKYQTVVRDAAGNILENQNVSFRFSIHDVAPAGVIVYSETHTAMTNEFGLVNLNIGSGVPVSGNFSTIIWGNGSKYLETEFDPSGGSSFVSMGTSQLLSVPYSLFSENTANNNDADADPANELQTLSIVGNNLSISDGNTVSLPALGTGSRISDSDGDTWIDTERTGDNDSIIFYTFGMERMVISQNGYVEVNGQMIATGFTGDGSGLTGIPGDDLGDHTATGDLNMNSNAIINLDDPQMPSDAANKSYVDAKPGDNLGNHTAIDDLDMNWNLISNLVNPINVSDAATKGYVDTKPGDNLGNHTATQNLAIGNNWISNDGNIEGIHIDTDGNVGINNAMPDQDLTVSGNIRSSNQVMAGFGSSTSASYRFGAGYENSGLSSPLANSVALITDGSQRMIVTQNGNIGIGTNSPANNLHIQGSFRLANGTQANGRVLTSDANGTSSWSEPASFTQNEWHTTGNSGTISGTHFIGTTNAQDLDIRTNNIIRARFTQKGQIETMNTGNSVFIGEGAGEQDNMTDNNNVFIGYWAGLANTSGHSNVAIGYQALQDNIESSCNTAVGYSSLRQNSTGYNNTAIGQNAMAFNGQGTNNAAVGHCALLYNTTGDFNNAMGSCALRDNTQGNYNNVYGHYAMFSNTTASRNLAIGNFALHTQSFDNGETSWESNNIAIGYGALYYNQPTSTINGINNVAIGHQSLYYNTTGLNNTAVGHKSLFSNTLGYQNAAFGRESLYANQNGLNNSAFGEKTLRSNTSGYNNNAFGTRALYSNTTGDENVAIGGNSLDANIDGSSNTAVGCYSMYQNTSGENNTAMGRASLYYNTSGYGNVTSGQRSLLNNTIGFYNTAVGFEAGYYNTIGSYNTYIGYAAGPNSVMVNLVNSTSIGYESMNTNSNQVRIGNSSVTSIGGYTGWTNLSDSRFKSNVRENVPGLAFILKLKPVTYTLDVNKLNNFLHIPDSISNADDFMRNSNLEKSQQVQTGFIAQDVEQVASELGYDFSGIDKPKNENDHYGLRYAEFVVPLVKAVQEQQLMIDELRLENKDLKSEIKAIQLMLNK